MGGGEGSGRRTFEKGVSVPPDAVLRVAALRDAFGVLGIPYVLGELDLFKGCFVGERGLDVCHARYGQTEAGMNREGEISIEITLWRVRYTNIRRL